MCDKELLVGYLYDELPPAERSKFEAHLFACPECREEVAALRATRAHLAQWAPPEPDLGFQIVRSGRGAVAAPRIRFSPAWGLAAAAVLLLAVASAIANLDVNIGRDGLSVRTGWSRTPPPVVATAPQAPSAVPVNTMSDDAWRAELRRVETRLGQIETAAAAREKSAPRTVSVAAGPRLTDAEIQQIRTLITEGDARVEREVALRLAQFVKDQDLQRRADLARIQQAMSRLEAYTTAEGVQQREMFNRLVRVSQGR